MVRILIALLLITTGVQAQTVISSVQTESDTIMKVFVDGRIIRVPLKNTTPPGSGVTTVGSLDGQTANANGATITGTTLHLQSASATMPGLMNTTTQTFTGNKTFAGDVIPNNNNNRLLGNSNFGWQAVYTFLVQPPASTNTLGFRYGGTTAAQQFGSSGRWQFQNGGTYTDIPSARVAINSTTEGFLIPRMTKAQRDAISSPAIGLMVYQTDATPGLRVYNGTNWMRFTETVD